jgi:hypothetical protein
MAAWCRVLSIRSDHAAYAGEDAARSAYMLETRVADDALVVVVHDYGIGIPGASASTLHAFSALHLTRRVATPNLRRSLQATAEPS